MPVFPIGKRLLSYWLKIMFSLKQFLSEETMRWLFASWLFKRDKIAPFHNFNSQFTFPQWGLCLVCGKVCGAGILTIFWCPVTFSPAPPWLFLVLVRFCKLRCSLVYTRLLHCTALWSSQLVPMLPPGSEPEIHLINWQKFNQIQCWCFHWYWKYN